MKTKFTTSEIKEWLEGWLVVDKYTNGRRESLSLESILVLLECDQDGIEAYFERKGDKIGWDKDRCNMIKEMNQKISPVGKFL